MKTTKKLLMVVLLLSMMCSSLSVPKQVSAKSVSKVTKVFTLTVNKRQVKHKLSISANEKVFTKVKFLDVKGKVSLISGEELIFGCYEGKNGMGSFFAPWTKPSLKKTSFKKGKTLTQNGQGDYINGKSEVEWYIPSGIKKLKVKVTYFTKSGKAGIKSIK